MESLVKQLSYRRISSKTNLRRRLGNLWGIFGVSLSFLGASPEFPSKLWAFPPVCDTQVFLKYVVQNVQFMVQCILHITCYMLVFSCRTEVLLHTCAMHGLLYTCTTLRNDIDVAALELNSNFPPFYVTGSCFIVRCMRQRL